MNSANILNLKLLHPPKPLAWPVADYAVPIFLRRDWQVLSYGWDLAIYWVSLYISSFANARQIAQRAEVDIAMVQACLRVLRQYQVIALVDMFLYSNKYESTEKVAAWLAGRDNKLLHDAVEFVLRRALGEASPSRASPTTGSPSGELVRIEIITAATNRRVKSHLHRTKRRTVTRTEFSIGIGIFAARWCQSYCTASGGVVSRRKDCRGGSRLRQRVATCMGERHCEDELVCQFERSYEDLLDLFPRQKIAQVFATEAS